MSDFLESINHLLGISDVQFVALITALAFLITWPIGRLVARRYPFEKLEISGEGIGSYCNVVGILYAIVMGYVLVNVYESYSAAEMAVETESALLIDILRDAEGLPFKDGVALRMATLRYIESVTQKEWPHMVEYANTHPETFERFSDLYHIMRRMKCETEEQRIFMSEILSRLNDLSTTRHQRLMASGARVPNMLWGMLISVGLVTFNLCFFFPVHNERMRVYFLCCTASVMTFTTMLIYVMDRPYSGTIGIQPDSIIGIVDTIKTKGVENLFQSNVLDPESKKEIEKFKDVMESIAPGRTNRPKIMPLPFRK
jgi:hypothetical protein